MQRETWTDERLDDMSRPMDQGLERVDRDLREMRGEFRDVRSEIRELRALIHRLGAGLLVAIVVSGFLQHSL